MAALYQLVVLGAIDQRAMRLRGRGLPGQTPGDQYIQLKIVVPPANTPEAREVFEEMKQEEGQAADQLALFSPAQALDFLRDMFDVGLREIAGAK